MTQLVRQSQVPADLAGERADKVAALLFSEFSRVALSYWIQRGALTVDGLSVKPRTRLIGGEQLLLDVILEPKEDWQLAEPVPFEVVYEDADLLVVSKPAGVVVHPGAGNPRGTLVNGLLNHRPSLALVPRAGIVHRLDKDTSGLLLVAGNLASHRRLVADLQERKVAREYLAVVEGVLLAGRDVHAPVGRDPVRRTRQRVRADGRPATTRFRVLERFRAHTLVGAELETGRTHQIRVHASSIGHPLVGDRVYGARGSIPRAAAPQLVDLIRGFRRQALHARRLTFAHPTREEEMDFTAEPPQDMTLLIGALRRDGEHDAEPR